MEKDFCSFQSSSSSAAPVTHRNLKEVYQPTPGSLPWHPSQFHPGAKPGAPQRSSEASPGLSVPPRGSRRPTAPLSKRFSKIIVDPVRNLIQSAITSEEKDPSCLPPHRAKCQQFADRSQKSKTFQTDQQSKPVTFIHKKCQKTPYCPGRGELHTPPI